MPLQVPSGGTHSRPSVDGSDTDAGAARNSPLSTPPRSASGVFQQSAGPRPEDGKAQTAAAAAADTVHRQQHEQQQDHAHALLHGGAHAAADNTRQQHQQQQQDHPHAPPQGQTSRVSLSPSLTEVSLQPRSNVH
eukprot:32631-Pelagomonas_calceolata.AAC.1